MKIKLLILLLLTFTFGITQENEKEILKRFESDFKAINSFMNNNNNSELHSIDFLKENYKKNENPYFKTVVNLLISGKYINIETSKSEEYLRKTESFVKENTQFKFINILYSTVENALKQKNKSVEGIEKTYKKNIEGLREFKEIDKIWKLEFWNTSLYINLLLSKNENDKAISELIILEKKINPKENIEFHCYILSQLGLCNFFIGNIEESKKKYLQVINHLENNEARYNNILLPAYNNLAIIYSKQNKKEEAISLLEKGYKITVKENIIDQQANLSKSLSTLYLEKLDLINAEKYAKISLIISQKNNYKDFESKSNLNLGKIYLKLNKPDDALNHIKKSIDFYNKNKNKTNIQSLVDALKTEIEINKSINNEITALKSSEELINVLDSLQKNNSSERLQETLVKYETEKKEAELLIIKNKNDLNIIKIEKRNQQLTFLIILFIGLIILGISIWYYQKKINVIRNLRYNSKLTRSQFNPHYINNAFTSLQAALIENDIDEKLINYTSDISRFSRLLLESTFKDEWTLYEEKQMIENYLKTQTHRYEGNFKFSILNVFSDTELHSYNIPSALTQTVLENAIEHGGYQNSKNGIIEISIDKNSTNEIIIKIKNNIVNNYERKKRNNDNPSRGLEILKKRILLYSKIYNKKAYLNFSSNIENYCVTITLPIIFSKKNLLE